MTQLTETTGRSTGTQGRNLALATVVFAVNFWAWNLIGPLATRYIADLGLTTTQNSILVAMPVLVGSVGRIPVGALTDRYGGRVMFTIVSLVTIGPVLLVAWAGERGSYPLLLVFGFFLGIGGTAFAVGIPFVNAWYEPARRGFATGVFGAGMGGTALSAFFTPRFVGWFGNVTTHIIIAAMLAVMAAIIWFRMKEAPGWTRSNAPVMPKLIDAAKTPVTWKLCFLYAVLFGGFVSFATYLPTYLRDVYSFEPSAAGARTAGFALAAVLARPVGGVLADKIGPKPVVIAALAGVAVLAWVVNLQPDGDVPAGLTFVAMAAALGLGTGGVFAWVGVLAPQGKVGSISGVVSAAGGLGGYFPPLIMGATYDAATHSYSIGLLLLVATALAALVFTIFAMHGRTKAKVAAA